MSNPSTNFATNWFCNWKLISPTLPLSSRTNTRSVGFEWQYFVTLLVDSVVYGRVVFSIGFLVDEVEVTVDLVFVVLCGDEVVAIVCLVVSGIVVSVSLLLTLVFLNNAKNNT